MRFPPECTSRPTAVAIMLAWALATASPAWSHEGHDMLPSTGAVVDGDRLLLSDGAGKGLGLQTADVRLGQIRRMINVRARVEAPWQGQALVTTLAPGRVAELLVKPGEVVKAGQRLARIDSRELEQLQLALLHARREAETLEQLVRQREPAVASGAIPGRSLLEQQAELAERRIAVETLEHKLIASGLSAGQVQRIGTNNWSTQQLMEPQSVEQLWLRSPISGRVGDVDVRVGQSVDSGTPLLRVIDDSRMLIVGEVLEANAGEIEIGMTVEIALLGLANEVAPGAIERVAASLDADGRRLDVFVPFDNAGGILHAGMLGRMTIHVATDEEAIVCPAAAVFETRSGAFVLVRQRANELERRRVEVGLRTANDVEILDGLFPGDPVVVVGTRVLCSMFSAEPDANHPVADEREGNRRVAAVVQDSLVPRSTAIEALGVVRLPTDGKHVVGSVVDGRVARLHVTPGETVETGQLLMEIDSHELHDLEMTLFSARRRQNLLNELIARIEPLADSGGYPRLKLLEHQRDRESVVAEAASVRRQLSQIGLSDRDVAAMELAHERPSSDENRDEEGGVSVSFHTLPIRAPAAGVISRFGNEALATDERSHAMLVTGQAVGSAMPLLEIHDLQSVWIEAYVAEQDVSRVAIDSEASVRLTALPGRELSGRVIRISPVLLERLNVLPVWIEVENPRHVLREGMWATVEIAVNDQ